MTLSTPKQQTSPWPLLPRHLQGTHHRIVAHPAGYQITPADIERVLSAAEFHVTGAALQKAYLACEFFHPNEISWAWLVDPDAPCVVTDLVVYADQEVSPCSCEASGLAVMRARREAQPLETKAAGHTHTLDGGLFSSAVDLARGAKMLASRYSWGRDVRAGCQGRCGPAEPAQPAEPAEAPAAPAVAVEFDGAPPLGLELRVRTAGVLPGDLVFELEWNDLRRDVTTFSTHNGEGAHVPLMSRDSCPRCGTALGQRVTSDVEIHLHHPLVLSHEEKSRFLAECERKTPRQHYYQLAGQFVSPWKQQADPESAPAAPTAGGALSRPADYVLSRRGRSWRVPPALMEEAASRVPALAQILWPEDGAITESSPEQEA